MRVCVCVGGGGARQCCSAVGHPRVRGGVCVCVCIYRAPYEGPSLLSTLGTSTPREANLHSCMQREPCSGIPEICALCGDKGVRLALRYFAQHGPHGGPFAALPAGSRRHQQVLHLCMLAYIAVSTWHSSRTTSQRGRRARDGTRA